MLHQRAKKRSSAETQRTVPLTQVMNSFRGCCIVYSVYSIVRHLEAVQVASENGFFTTFAKFLSAQTSPALPCLSCPVLVPLHLLHLMQCSRIIRQGKYEIRVHYKTKPLEIGRQHLVYTYFLQQNCAEIIIKIANVCKETD
jgi:hypothetical protein